jgi:hypothetical protein
MNVLLVLPDISRVSDSAQGWNDLLLAGDRLVILTCNWRDRDRALNHETHDLARMFVFAQTSRWRRKFLRLLFKRIATKITRKYSRLSAAYFFLLWIAILSQWKALSDEAGCFDPDIVDLRPVPMSVPLKNHLTKDFDRSLILSKRDTPRRVDTSWRRYDPKLKISIVLPVYNGARYLSTSIDSCLAQTHSNIELIIVDDASTDATPDIIRKYERRDKRIVSIRNERNLRLPGTLNKGFASAKGDLLTWTSHDNYYDPSAIETLVRYLCSHPDVDFVCSAYHYVDENDRVDQDILYPSPLANLPMENAVGPSFLYRRRVYDVVGDYRPETEYYEDYDYWLRVSKNFKMERLYIPLYYYRYHPESMSARLKAVSHNPR